MKFIELLNLPPPSTELQKISIDLVENIETTRILLAITFDPECKLDTITRQQNIDYKIIL